MRSGDAVSRWRLLHCHWRRRRGFSFPENARIWVPLDTAARNPHGRRGRPSRCRRVAGAGRSRTDGRARGRARRSRESLRDRVAVTTSLRLRMIGTKQRDMATFVLTAAALVLLVACGNLAGILTAYVDARKHEIAVRAAIGASRARLVRQLMTESAMLALAGGTLGLLLANGGRSVLRQSASPRARTGRPGGRWPRGVVCPRRRPCHGAAVRPRARDQGRAGRPARRVTGRQENVRSRPGPAPPSRSPCRRSGRLVDCARRRGGRDRPELDGLSSMSMRGSIGTAACRACGWRSPDVPTRNRSSGLRSSMPRPSGCEGYRDRRRVGSKQPPADGPGGAARSLRGRRKRRDGAPPFASVRFVDSDYVAAMAIPVRRGRGSRLGKREVSPTARS